MVEMINACIVLIEREGKISHGRLAHKWEDNIKMDLLCEGVDWIQLAHGRNQWPTLMDTVMNLWYHTCGEFLY
jgi:hypothetical protein